VVDWQGSGIGGSERALAVFLKDHHSDAMNGPGEKRQPLTN